MKLPSVQKADPLDVVGRAGEDLTREEGVQEQAVIAVEQAVLQEGVGGALLRDDGEALLLRRRAR